jgi:adenylate cyclase
MHEWKPAQEYFVNAVKVDVNDYLSQLYLRRSIEFSKNPPPDDWDGVLTLSEK